MGIFNKNKNKNITPQNEESDCLIEKAKLSGGRIFIGSTLTVPQGYMFVVGRNGKVYDTFSSGEYKLCYENLPLICKKFKVTSTKQAENVSFDVDGYFVNMSLLQYPWETYKTVIGSKAEGYLKFSVGGKYIFKVISINDFVQSFLNEFSFIKTGEAEKILDGWICDAFNSLLDKNIFTVDQIVKNKPIVYERFFDTIKKLFAVIGASLEEFTIDFYKLPRAYREENAKAMSAAAKKETADDEHNASDQQTNNANSVSALAIDVQGQQEENQAAEASSAKDLSPLQEESKEQTLTEEKQEDSQEKSPEEQIVKEQKPSFNYTPFGNMKFFSAEKSEENGTAPRSESEQNEQPQNLLNEQQTEQIKDENFCATQSSETPNLEQKQTQQPALDSQQKNDQSTENSDKAFVDLNVNNLYNTKVDGNICAVCGTINNSSQDFCKTCGNLLRR